MTRELILSLYSVFTRVVSCTESEIIGCTRSTGTRLPDIINCGFLSVVECRLPESVVSERVLCIHGALENITFEYLIPEELLL